MSLSRRLGHPGAQTTGASWGIYSPSGGHSERKTEAVSTTEAGGRATRPRKTAQRATGAPVAARERAGRGKGGRLGVFRR